MERISFRSLASLGESGWPVGRAGAKVEDGDEHRDLLVVKGVLLERPYCDGGRQSVSRQADDFAASHRTTT